MKRSWEIIADNLKKAGFSVGWVSALNDNGRTIWITDAHRAGGNRFVVQADEKLTAFVELETAIHQFAVRCFRSHCPLHRKREIHLRLFLSIHHNNRKIAIRNPTQNTIA